MKVVYEAGSLIDAHLVKHALEAADIPVYLRGEALVGGMGELPLFGVVGVCVPEAAWIRAREIVDELALDEPLPGQAADEQAPGPDGLLA